MLPHNWNGGSKSCDFVFGGTLKFYDRCVNFFFYWQHEVSVAGENCVSVSKVIILP